MDVRCGSMQNVTKFAVATSRFTVPLTWMMFLAMINDILLHCVPSTN